MKKRLATLALATLAGMAHAKDPKVTIEALEQRLA